MERAKRTGPDTGVGMARFHAWLMNNRYLGGYIRNYREGRGLPMLQKVCTIGLLWTTIGLSIVYAVDAWWGQALLALIAIAVTVHIVTLPTYRAVKS